MEVNLGKGTRYSLLPQHQPADQPDLTNNYSLEPMAAVDRQLNHLDRALLLAMLTKPSATRCGSCPRTRPGASRSSAPADDDRHRRLRDELYPRPEMPPRIAAALQRPRPMSCAAPTRWMSTR